MKLLFATQNPHKIEEIKKIINPSIELMGLETFGFDGEIPETKDTIKENAIEKARFIYNKFKIPTFADDTGLEVDALDGMPGVLSARYAGIDKNSESNMNKLLMELKGVHNRNAQFRTVIALILDDREFVFEGIVKGQIMDSPRGSMGFGYDPIFLPDGYGQTFAEMELGLKNTISHRAQAFNNLTAFLNRNFN